MVILGVQVDEIPEDCTTCTLFRQCEKLKKTLSKGKKCPLVPTPPPVIREKVVGVSTGVIADTISFMLHDSDYK